MCGDERERNGNKKRNTDLVRSLPRRKQAAGSEGTVKVCQAAPSQSVSHSIQQSNKGPSPTNINGCIVLYWTPPSAGTFNFWGIFRVLVLLFFRCLFLWLCPSSRSNFALWLFFFPPKAGMQYSSTYIARGMEAHAPTHTHHGILDTNSNIQYKADRHTLLS